MRFYPDNKLTHFLIFIICFFPVILATFYWEWQSWPVWIIFGGIMYCNFPQNKESPIITVDSDSILFPSYNNKKIPLNAIYQIIFQSTGRFNWYLPEVKINFKLQNNRKRTLIVPMHGYSDKLRIDLFDTIQKRTNFKNLGNMNYHSHYMRNYNVIIGVIFCLEIYLYLNYLFTN